MGVGLRLPLGLGPHPTAASLSLHVRPLTLKRLRAPQLVGKERWSAAAQARTSSADTTLFLG